MNQKLGCKIILTSVLLKDPVALDNADDDEDEKKDCDGHHHTG